MDGGKFHHDVVVFVDYGPPKDHVFNDNGIGGDLENGSHDGTPF
jgi:hypothetical protein